MTVLFLSGYEHDERCSLGRSGAPQMISAYCVQLSFSGGAIRYTRSSGDSNSDRISFFGSSFICLAS